MIFISRIYFLQFLRGYLSHARLTVSRFIGSIKKHSLVFSKMFYCSTVWSNTSASNVKKLQLLEKIRAQIITNSRKYDHITTGVIPLLLQLNWLPVEQLLYLRGSVMAYKCVKNLASTYLCNKFRKRSPVHN